MSGLELAAARALAGRGLRVALVDREGDALDVAEPKALVTLAEELGEPPCTADEQRRNRRRWRGICRVGEWRRPIDVKLMGVLHGVAAFASATTAGDPPGIFINTGPKQGIT